MKKKFVVYGVIITVVLAASYFQFSKGENTGEKFTFAEVTRGDINLTITSTGTLEALSTVEVGTQVSGIIAKLNVDFNSEVKKGQLLAILDTVTLAATVRDQQANMDKAKAVYNQAAAIHERNKKLYEKSFISELDFIESQTNVASALASLKSSESALERAKTNLNYAFVYSPISGKIIDRSVEQGQTVAASLSAPTLFTIAEDLSSMRILANVDESDIGEIKEGQKVEFTVQTYSDKTFEGKVTQIRLSPTIISNVVNYTVVITADNREKLLLPGMTATVDFYIESSKDALLVSNVALRLQATDEMFEEFQKNMEEERTNLPDSIRNKFNNPSQRRQAGKMFKQNNNKSNSNMKRVWYLDSNGKLKMSPVITGLTDGKNTEIVRSKDLKEGMKIITAVTTGETSGATNTNILSGSQTQQRRMGPPPGGF